MLKRLSIISCAIAGLLISVPAGADVLKIDGKRVVAKDNTPTRGMNKSQVKQRYGAPVSKKGAVGQPPISSWDYGNYTVYFEYDKVLHSVVRRN